MPIFFPQIGDEQQFLFLGRDPRRPGLELPAFADRLEENAWPGIDGVGLWNLGKRAEAADVLGIRDETDEDEACERIKDYEALSGTLQTVLTAAGVSWQNVAVELLSSSIVKISTPAGRYLSAEAPTHLVFSWWRLRRTEEIA